jgi:hypothetical protein
MFVFRSPLPLQRVDLILCSMVLFILLQLTSIFYSTAAVFKTMSKIAYRSVALHVAGK